MSLVRDAFVAVAMIVAGSSLCQTRTNCLRGLAPARSYNRAMHRSTDVVLGSLATAGGALLGFADQRLPKNAREA
jgi:hypothetical protein